MKQTVRSTASLAVAVLLALSAGCGDAGSSEAVAEKPPTSPARGAAPAPSPTEVVPTQVSDLPDGVYRSQLTVDQLTKAGFYDMSNAGTFTLTVKAGSFQLDCQPLEDPGIDCGNKPGSSRETVELGTLRGTSPTVWFVNDHEKLSKLNGCVIGSQSATGCGPDDPYHLDWKLTPAGLVFTNFVGLGEQAGFSAANWIAQPYTRIS